MEDILRQECEQRGLPVSLTVLLRHIEHNHIATIGAKDSLIASLQAQLESVGPSTNKGIPLMTAQSSRSRPLDNPSDASSMSSEYANDGHDQTLRLLASLYDQAEGRRSDVEDHLRAQGWEYISDHWMSPDDIAHLTKICKHCFERFELFDTWTTDHSHVNNSCYARNEFYATHETEETRS
jgi:hypothetical protein